MATPHNRGLAAQDSLGLFATEATPFTAETFASGDYLKMEGRPIFTPVNSVDDLGQMVGGFDRSEIMPGSMYGRFSGSGLLRRAVDADDGPESAYAALLLGCGMSGTANAATNYTFARSNDNDVWEANRYTARIDHHGDNKIMYGCLTESITYQYEPGKAVRYGFQGVGLVSGTYATHRPAEDDPAGRTPTVSFASAQSAPPFVFQSATIQYASSTALQVAQMSIGIECSVSPVMSGSATFGVDSLLLVDRIFTVNMSVLRPLQATKKLDEEFLWLQNNSLAGGSMIVTLASGSRGLVQTLSAVHQTGYPTETVINGLNYVNLTLRGTGTFSQVYT